MCKLGDSGLIIVRYFIEIFFRYMPLCVLLANVYFKLFNGRHYKPMQNQLKLASYVFYSILKRRKLQEGFIVIFFSRPAGQRMHEELGKAVNAQPVPSGGRWSPELPKCVAGLIAEDFCRPLPGLPSALSFPRVCSTIT